MFDHNVYNYGLRAAGKIIINNTGKRLCAILKNKTKKQQQKYMCKACYKRHEGLYNEKFLKIKFKKGITPMFNLNFIKPDQSFHQTDLQDLHKTRSLSLCIIIFDTARIATSNSSLVVYSKPQGIQFSIYK